MNHKLTVVAVLGVVWLSAAFAAAQSSTSGAIAGTVKDTTGAVLPGVTVEAASPALIEKVRTTVTDEQGNYKVADLRPGTYTVTFTLTGFSTFKREGIQLTTGFTASANAEMKVGALEETVTVTGSSPIVDTQNVRTQNVLTEAVLTALPTAKTLQGLYSLTLGTAQTVGTKDVGGNQGEGYTGFKVHGTHGTDARLTLEGMQVNALQAGAGARQWVPNQVITEETTLETAGIGAESETGGVQINHLVKSGGNTFHVTGITLFANDKLQASNLSPALIARGAATPGKIKRIWDYGLAVGGPVLKDRLWFQTGTRYWGAENYVPGSYYNKDLAGVHYVADLSRRGYNYSPNRDPLSLKMTWQATSKDKLSVYNSFQHDCQCLYNQEGGQQGTGRFTPDVQSYQYSPSRLTQATWSRPQTNRLLWDAGVSALRLCQCGEPGGGEGSQFISITETTNSLTYTNAPGGYAATQNQVRVVKFNGSFVTGSHALKAGAEVRDLGVQVFPRFGPFDSLLSPANVAYTFTNGVPISLTQYIRPYVRNSGVRPNLGIYVQDQWKVDRLTLNLGVRYDSLRGYVPAQHQDAGPYLPAQDFPEVKNVPNWKDINPRMGVGYDVFGNGKTAIKGFVGRYIEGEQNSVAGANVPSNLIVTSATRTWTDTNGNFVPDCALTTVTANGECGALTNLLFGSSRPATVYSPSLLNGWGIRPRNWQASLSVQHEIRPGVALNAGYFLVAFRGAFAQNPFVGADPSTFATHNLATTPADFSQYRITAPVDARLPGGGGNQLCSLYDISPGKFGQVRNEVTRPSDFGHPYENNHSIDVGVSARFGRGGLFTGGVSESRKIIDSCVVVNSPQEARPGFCHLDLPGTFAQSLQAKISAIYPLPAKFQVSAVWENLPGIPITANYVATNAQIAPSLGRNLAAGPASTVTIDLLPPTVLFEDRLNQVDLRFNRTFRVGTVRIDPTLDIYNVFNANTVLSINTRYGPNWLTPTAILTSRFVKFGVQVNF